MFQGNQTTYTVIFSGYSDRMIRSSIGYHKNHKSLDVELYNINRSNNIFVISCSSGKIVSFNRFISVLHYHFNDCKPGPYAFTIRCYIIWLMNITAPITHLHRKRSFPGHNGPGHICKPRKDRTGPSGCSLVHSITKLTELKSIAPFISVWVKLSHYSHSSLWIWYSTTFIMIDSLSSIIWQ